MRIVRLASATAVALAFGLTACDKPAVEWSDPVPIAEPAAASAFVIDSAGKPGWAPQATITAFPDVQGLCGATFVTAAGSSRLHAAFWAVRPDSSAVVYVSSSADSGKTWDPAVRVDTTDVSSNGCSRPSPALAAVGEDAYVAYSMKAPEGTGVFFAHSMSSMIHSPVPVIYGDRLVATAIAADANRVVVAYENPNGRREQVDVAISDSQGHLFERHEQASRSIDVALAPRVAFRGASIAVSWLTRRPMESATSRVVRTGRVR